MSAPFIISTLLLLSLGSHSYSNNEIWNQKENFGGSARHRCTAFSIGNKGYLGLGHINAVSNVSYEDFWEYDPGTNIWTQKADFGGGLRYHAVGFSISGKGYVGTGRTETGNYENDLWEFDPLANTWIPKSNFPGGDRRGCVSFVIENIAYVGSGEVEGFAISNEFFAYEPLSDSWYQINTFPGVTRTSAVAFAIGTKGYFGTGGMAFGSTDFWEYNPSTDAWLQLADVGPTPRMEACGFAVNGKGYIGTGDDFSSGNNYSDFWEYTPQTNSWQQIQDFPGIARRYMVSFVIGNKAYAGVGTNGTNFNDFWEFDKTLDMNQNEFQYSFAVYPNPASDYLNINVNSNQVSDTKFELISSDGRVIITAFINSSETQLSLQNLNAGKYYYQISSNQNRIQSGAIVIQ